MGARVEIFMSKITNKWYWRMRAANNRIIATSAEGFSSERAAHRACWAVYRNCHHFKFPRVTDR
jgi:uncharacterized protein YegP (UPF0339 family)